MCSGLPPCPCSFLCSNCLFGRPRMCTDCCKVGELWGNFAIWMMGVNRWRGIGLESGLTVGWSHISWIAFFPFRFPISDQALLFMHWVGKSGWRWPPSRHPSLFLVWCCVRLSSLRLQRFYWCTHSLGSPFRAQGRQASKLYGICGQHWQTLQEVRFVTCPKKQRLLSILNLAPVNFEDWQCWRRQPRLYRGQVILVFGCNQVKGVVRMLK